MVLQLFQPLLQQRRCKCKTTVRMNIIFNTLPYTEIDLEETEIPSYGFK